GVGAVTAQSRLRVFDYAARDMIRDVPYLYAFALANPTPASGNQSLFYYSTGLSTQSSRAQQYVNNSGRGNANGRCLDGDSSAEVITAGGKILGSPVVMCSQFLFADGLVRSSKDLETPSELSLASSQNTSDTAALILAIGGSGSSSFANILNGPYYRL